MKLDNNKPPKKRVSKCELLASLVEITNEDKTLLKSLALYRYLLTSQITRLYFRHFSSELSALKATNRQLKRLQDKGIVETLNRRIGGVRSGSSSYVWRLSSVGMRLVDLLDGIEGKNTRKRSYEPSAAFLQHMLAVAELSIQLIELGYTNNFEVSVLSPEQECRRNYTNAGGTISTLRPDLFAITAASPDYDDHWFFEVDLATESPSVVVRKCQQYIAYLNSGKEQSLHGVFPKVVWIVPDDKRKDTLKLHIAEKLPSNRELFVVITLDELPSLVLEGED